MIWTTSLCFTLRGRSGATRSVARKETESFLEQTIEHYQDPGMAVSAVVVAHTSQLVGWTGLSVPMFLPELLPAVEVGWRLGERHRGRGFATEAAEAWIRDGRDVALQVGVAGKMTGPCC